MKILLRAVVGIGLIYASAQYFGWTPQSQYLPQLNFDGYFHIIKRHKECCLTLQVEGSVMWKVGLGCP